MPTLSVTTSTTPKQASPSFINTVIPEQWRTFFVEVWQGNDTNVKHIAKAVEIFFGTLRSIHPENIPFFENMQKFGRNAFNFTEVLQIPQAFSEACDAVALLKLSTLSRVTFREALLKVSTFVAKCWASILFLGACGMRFSKAFWHRFNVVYLTGVIISSYIQSSQAWESLMNRTLGYDLRMIALIQLISQVSWLCFGTLSLATITFIPAMPIWIVPVCASISFIAAAIAYLYESTVIARDVARGATPRRSPLHDPVDSNSNRMGPGGLHWYRVALQRTEEAQHLRAALDSTSAELTTAKDTLRNMTGVAVSFSDQLGKVQADSSLTDTSALATGLAGEAAPLNGDVPVKTAGGGAGAASTSFGPVATATHVARAEEEAEEDDDRGDTPSVGGASTAPSTTSSQSSSGNGSASVVVVEENPAGSS